MKDITLKNHSTLYDEVQKIEDFDLNDVNKLFSFTEQQLNYYLVRNNGLMIWAVTKERNEAFDGSRFETLGIFNDHKKAMASVKKLEKFYVNDSDVYINIDEFEINKEKI